MSIPVDKTLDEIRTELFDRINEVQGEYVQKGWMPRVLNLNKGIVRGMIEIWAWGLFQLYAFMAIVLKQILVKSSSGSWLGLLCEDVDVKFKDPKKAKGTIYFTRVETQGNVPIPASRIVKTLPDGTGRVFRFVTTQDVILLDESDSVAVPVESEEYGNATNVSAGQITEIVTTIPGVDGVENREGWLDSEGADIETEDSLKDRYTLKWKGNNGCNKYAYEGWGLGVPGVVAAKILDQHPRGQGTVDVVLQGTGGVPTAELISLVDEAIQGENPVNDDVLVKGVVPVEISLSGELILVHGDPDTILSDVATRLNGLFASGDAYPGILSFKIGEDVTMERLIAVIMGVDGIKEIAWVSPADSIPVPDDGLAVLTEINFTTSWAESV